MGIKLLSLFKWKSCMNPSIPFSFRSFFDNNRNIILILCQSESEKSEKLYSVPCCSKPRHEILPCHTLVGEHKACMWGGRKRMGLTYHVKVIIKQWTSKVGMKLKLLIICAAPALPLERKTKYKYFYFATINRAFSRLLSLASHRLSSLQKYAPAVKARGQIKRNANNTRTVARLEEKFCIGRKNVFLFLSRLVCSRFHFNINKQIGWIIRRKP